MWEHPLGDLRGTPRGRAVRDVIRRGDQQIAEEARSIFTISRTVTERLREFSEIESTPLYHPPANAAAFYNAETAGDYLFFPSRLSAVKRQELVLRALALTQQPVRVKFAGVADSPPYGERLRKLARELSVERRVEWLGFITEEEKRDAYAHARAIIFPPVNEDYGYVTLEAMLASKAVITCQDSGGPLEFLLARQDRPRHRRGRSGSCAGHGYALAGRSPCAKTGARRPAPVRFDRAFLAEGDQEIARMKLNWFSPVPPTPSSIALDTAAILPALAQRAKVTVWVHEQEWSPELEAHAEVRRYDLEAMPWREINAADISVYHLGNHNAFHGPIWQVHRQHPGIVVLHDLNMQHFFNGLLLDTGAITRSDYLRLMTAHHGEEGRELAKAFLSGAKSVDEVAHDLLAHGCDD